MRGMQGRRKCLDEGMLIPDIEIFMAALEALENLPTHRMHFRWGENRIDSLRFRLAELIGALDNLTEEED